MNSSGKRESDAAGRFIVPVKIEKAPDGFTERVMMQISMENAPAHSHQKSGNELIIPAFAFITALILIIIAGLTTSTENMFLNTASQLLKNVNAWLPEINVKTIPGFNLPVILFYITTGILILALFDLALNRLFRFRKKR